jgi:predicted DsbA family dithiol-disulfide isomerase
MTAAPSGVGPHMQVEIWSDVVCPWCYIGKRRFEEALRLFEHGDEVEVTWRSFELDPNAPAEREGSYAARIGRKYGVGVDEAQAMIDRMTASAAGDGLDIRFDRLRGGNTFDAHRLLHLAAAEGVQDAAKERLFAATFTEGEPVGDREALVRRGVELGLDEARVREVLGSDEFAEEVRADEAAGQELGISGVPFFVFDGRFGLSGAHPPHQLAKALATAWRESHPVEVLGGAGEACEGDACAL